jgi:hypothetical protein
MSYYLAHFLPALDKKSVAIGLLRFFVFAYITKSQVISLPLLLALFVHYSMIL